MWAYPEKSDKKTGKGKQDEWLCSGHAPRAEAISREGGLGPFPGGLDMTQEKLKAWIQASRPPFFVATVVPIVIGWTMARDSRPLLFFLILLGAFLVHFATNIVNDYFDYLEGADAGTSIGGSRVIQEGKISPGQILGPSSFSMRLPFSSHSA